MAPDPLSRAVEQFIDHLRHQRRYSPATLDNYSRSLAALGAHAHNQHVRRWSALRAEQVQAFVAAEHRRGLAPGTLKHMLAACRSFFRHLVRENQATSNPALGIRSPKAPRKLPQVLDVDEVAALLDFPAGDGEAVRDRALLELLYSSGLRV
jgi:integrase/recombinase XerC